MAYFKLNRFFGTAPAVSPRLLADQFGQTAEDLDLESGRLVAIKEDSEVFTLNNSARRSIYKYYSGGNEYWLEWDEDNVSVVPGPIPGDQNDRLYWTGEGGASGYPRMATASLVTAGTPYPNGDYRLGIPFPSAAPSVSVTGTANANSIPNDVSYVYTFVSIFGEESAPSAPSAVVSMSDGQTATIGMPANAQPSGAGYGHLSGGSAFKRIYRSNTGSVNTTFQLVTHVTAGGASITNGNIPYTTTSATDSMLAANLAEVLPSDGWIPPPNDDSSLYPDGPLQGLIPLAQGIMAGFTGKRFCLSEAFLPTIILLFSLFIFITYKGSLIETLICFLCPIV